MSRFADGCLGARCIAMKLKKVPYRRDPIATWLKLDDETVLYEELKGKGRYTVLFRMIFGRAYSLNVEKGRNVATFKIVDKNNVKNAKRNMSARYLTFASSQTKGNRGPALHSEQRLIEEFANLCHSTNDGINRFRVKWIYTERQPCNDNEKSCHLVLEKFLNQYGLFGDDTEVFYSFDYPSEHDTAKRSVLQTSPRIDYAALQKMNNSVVGVVNNARFLSGRDQQKYNSFIIKSHQLYGEAWNKWVNVKDSDEDFDDYFIDTETEEDKSGPDLMDEDEDLYVSDDNDNNSPYY